jgi:hypothetical protein
MARFVLDVTRSVALAWLLEVEHPDQRIIAFDSVDVPALRAWLGAELDEVYDLTSRMTEFDEPRGS